jgi:hypothetical protein
MSERWGDSARDRAELDNWITREPEWRSVPEDDEDYSVHDEYDPEYDPDPDPDALVWCLVCEQWETRPVYKGES